MLLLGSNCTIIWPSFAPWQLIPVTSVSKVTGVALSNVTEISSEHKLSVSVNVTI